MGSSQLLRGVVNDAPTPKSSPHSTSTNRRRLLLGSIILLALGVSFTNLVIGQLLLQQNANLLQQNQTIHDLLLSADPKIIMMPLLFHESIDNQQDVVVYDGKIITKILQGKKKFPGGNNDNSKAAAAAAHRRLRLKYKPGTLQLSSAEALQYCFVNTTHYQNHISTTTKKKKESLVSLSDHYKIIYRNIPKSSSSSARHAMQDFLEGKDVIMKHDNMKLLVHVKNYSLISFVREPLNRFYSSYDEAFFRFGPWMGEGPLVDDKPKVRKFYQNNKQRVDKYPYLYEGLATIDDFHRLYCPEEVLATGRFWDCDMIPSIDGGADNGHQLTLTHRFEQFVQDYSGLDPFDAHLNLQTSDLVFSTGEPMPITTLYNASQAEKGWQEVIARHRGVKILKGEMTHGRKITRRFNVSKVSDLTKRKICKILALDYCCLNIKLPDVCQEEEDDDDSVYCAMEQRDAVSMKYALNRFVIHPWKDP